MPDADIRRAVTRLSKKFGTVPVIYVDEVGKPNDDGRFVSVILETESTPTVVLVFTTENFYAALGKVMNATLPASTGKKLS